MSKQDDSNFCYNILAYLDDMREVMQKDKIFELAKYYNAGYQFYRDLYYPTRLN